MVVWAEPDRLRRLAGRAHRARTGLMVPAVAAEVVALAAEGVVAALQHPAAGAMAARAARVRTVRSSSSTEVMS